MAIETSTDEWGREVIHATGKDVKALSGAMKEVNEEERDRRLTGNHERHLTPGVAIVADPPANPEFLGFDDDGKVLWSRPQKNARCVRRSRGWVVVRKD